VWAPRQEELLSDCVVSPHVFAHMVDRLCDFAVSYQHYLETEAGKRNVHLDLAGLLSHMECKHAEEISSMLTWGKKPRTKEAETSGDAPPTHPPFYCGLDLHVRRLDVCIVRHDGAILFPRTMQAAPAPLLKALAPYRDGLVGAVAYLFTWYGALTSARRRVWHSSASCPLSASPPRRPGPQGQERCAKPGGTPARQYAPARLRL
jgi:hypothetical protein